MTDHPTPKPTVRAPAWWKLALEARAPFEFGAGLAALAPLLAIAPRGDGHPVLVYPGFGAGDGSTEPLRRVLGLLGYKAIGWGAGRNTGMRPEWLAEGAARVRALQREHGRKVSLIGQSLGGIYARELAKRAPDEVRCVITLGTPFTGPAQATNAWRLYEWVNGKAHRTGPLRDSVRAAPPEHLAERQVGGCELPSGGRVRRVHGRHHGSTQGDCHPRRQRDLQPRHPRHRDVPVALTLF